MIDDELNKDRAFQYIKKNITMMKSKYIVLLLIGFVLTFESCGRNEVTSYPVLTLEDGRKLAQNRTRYRALPNSDTIIYWMPGFHDFRPRKLINCVIKNKNNWTGEYPDALEAERLGYSGYIRMSRGKIVESSLLDHHKKHGDEFEYVSALRWWYYSFFLKPEESK